MKLYNAWYCPFAQRAWTALVYMGIDFEYVEIDPYDKTDWWLKVSRGAALVPVVVQSNADGEGETWQRYRLWYETMLAHPAFRKTAFDQDDYEKRLVDHYYPYSLGEGQADVTRVN